MVIAVTVVIVAILALWQLWRLIVMAATEVEILPESAEVCPACRMVVERGAPHLHRWTVYKLEGYCRECNRIVPAGADSMCLRCGDEALGVRPVSLDVKTGRGGDSPAP